LNFTAPTTTTEDINKSGVLEGGLKVSIENWVTLLRYYFKWVEYFGVLPRREKKEE